MREKMRAPEREDADVETGAGQPTTEEVKSSTDVAQIDAACEPELRVTKRAESQVVYPNSKPVKMLELELIACDEYLP